MYNDDPLRQPRGHTHLKYSREKGVREKVVEKRCLRKGGEKRLLRKGWPRKGVRSGRSQVGPSQWADRSKAAAEEAAAEVELLLGCI
jgi:hypothetical protein